MATIRIVSYVLCCCCVYALVIGQSAVISPTDSNSKNVTVLGVGPGPGPGAAVVDKHMVVGRPLQSAKSNTNDTGYYDSPMAGRLLCLVHTASPSHDTLARAVYDLWARQCDAVMFFTNAPLEWPDVSDPPSYIYFPNFSTRRHSWEKIIHVMRYVYETVGNDFDWILRADDDAYVFVDNARTLISRRNPDHPHLLGFRWGFYAPYGFADGSTYILSRTVLAAFVNVSHDQALCPEFHRAEEDQELATCLAKVGVVPMDSRDPDGRDRFYQFHPEEIQNLGRQHFIQNFGYYRFLPYPDHVSPSTVSMHHLTSYEMHFIDYLVHTVEIISDNTGANTTNLPFLAAKTNR